MPNSNCLQNIKCPKCGNETSFRIEASIICTVTDDGSEATGDHHHWDENSYACCPLCETEGKLAIFMSSLADRSKPSPQYTISINNDDGDCYDIVIKQNDKPIATLIAPEAEVAPLVHAGNCHEGLVNAARQALRELREFYLDTDSQAIMELKAALEKVGAV